VNLFWVSSSDISISCPCIPNAKLNENKAYEIKGILVERPVNEESDMPAELACARQSEISRDERENELREFISRFKPPALWPAEQLEKLLIDRSMSETCSHDTCAT
jgi:hypothetical protein